ncbi:hypothetical protein RND71_020434 [Anisodus tanguticus]|uniref:Uncharacterized protein n=1 Tax=Anisodus tanguticus TaxID=243964 RepID=A0AAE1S1G3_9SOLA|nr:hypothetical protein RND71_020434 [Anisodus tanguticus]
MNDFSRSHISPNFVRFSSLTYLDLSDSRFTSQIPSEISNLSKLRSLRIYGYSSGLSLEPYNFQLLLTNLTQLRELDLYSVSIFSVIPPNFSSHLTTLRLPDAQLHRILPERVFHLPNLKFLDLSQNYQLIVTFSMTKWNSSASLKDFYLWSNSNSLTPIPSDDSGQQILWLLILSSNNLNGTIPSWIPSLPSLSYLDLSNNHLSGQMEEFKYNKLFWIDLGKNQLQNLIPNSLLNQPDLIFLNLSSTNFSRNLDFSMFSNLSDLDTLDLSHNSYFSWTNENQEMSNLPTLSDFNLRYNMLQGSLPIPSIYVQHFFISHNNLSGKIPSIICNLDSLRILDLASNSLKGAIPPCLGNMRRVEVPREMTTPALDEEEDSGFEISWEAALMGYGCGLIIGFSIVYILLSTQNPTWFSRMIEEWEHRIITRKQKKVARQVRFQFK